MALRPDTRRLGKGAALPRPLPLPRQGGQTPEAGGRLALDCSIHFTHWRGTLEGPGVETGGGTPSPAKVCAHAWSVPAAGRVVPPHPHPILLERAGPSPTE